MVEEKAQYQRDSRAFYGVVLSGKLGKLEVSR